MRKNKDLCQTCFRNIDFLHVFFHSRTVFLSNFPLPGKRRGVPFFMSIIQYVMQGVVLSVLSLDRGKSMRPGFHAGGGGVSVQHSWIMGVFSPYGSGEKLCVGAAAHWTGPRTLEGGRRREQDCPPASAGGWVLVGAHTPERCQGGGMRYDQPSTSLTVASSSFMSTGFLNVLMAPRALAVPRR